MREPIIETCLITRTNLGLSLEPVGSEWLFLLKKAKMLSIRTTKIHWHLVYLHNVSRCKILDQVPVLGLNCFSLKHMCKLGSELVLFLLDQKPVNVYNDI